MKSIRGVFFFMNDSCGEINTLLKTQKNTKSNVLKERVIATQQKEEETEDTSCRPLSGFSGFYYPELPVRSGTGLSQEPDLCAEPWLWLSCSICGSKSRGRTKHCGLWL